MESDTILAVLTQKPPDLNREREGTGRNTRGPFWVDVADTDVSLWHDFTFETIMAAYGDLLGRTAPGDPRRRIRAEDMSLSDCDIVCEDAMDFFFHGWFGKVVKGCMKDTPSLACDLDPAISRGKPEDESDGTKAKAFNPDWLIHVHPDGQVFVVGESKLDSKWKSQWSSSFSGPGKRLKTDHQAERIWPIRQIATYCNRANTRYGFLFTPLELVAVRVSNIPTTSLSTSCGVEYRSVPYANWGGQKLTVSLALWALAMMGANENVRNCALKRQYVSLGSWSRQRGTGSNKLVHCLSGRQMDENTVRQHLGSLLIIHPDQGPAPPLMLPVPAAAYPVANKSTSSRKTRASPPLSTVRNARDTDDPGAYSPDEAEREEPGPSKRTRRNPRR
ncbi:hypothetical protein V8F06_005085 [Rhypophila decipiens]